LEDSAEDEAEVEARAGAEAEEAGVLVGLTSQLPLKHSRVQATPLRLSKLLAFSSIRLHMAVAFLLLNSSTLLALQSYSSSMMKP